MAHLIETKLQSPRLPAGRVDRPRLYSPFVGRNGIVVLVSAPPGFGKSTFVVEWMEAQSRPYTWYSLDPFDQDPGLFSEYLGAAVGRLVGRETGLQAVPGEQAPDVRSMISMLVDDLASAEPGSFIVLDDYHSVEGQQVNAAVGYLIEHLPPHVGLVLITRADPALPLARLRAQDRLVDVRGDQLRFTPDEVGEYFRNATGLKLSPAERDALAERSEGWIAALQLVSLGSAAGDGTDLVEELSAEHRHIAAYLVEEVLERLPPDLAGFLIDAAALQRFDVELCRAATDAADPAALIDELERRNAFLIPLSDGPMGWFRFHHLFADLLRHELRRVDPDREIEVLVTAARACDARGLPDDAIDYALRAGDLGLAGDIVDRHTRAQLAAGRIARLRSWLSRFPRDAGPASPAVTLGWAWCRLFEGNVDAADEFLDRVESEFLEAFEGDIRGQLEIMRALAAFQRADPAAAEEHALRGLDLLPASSQYMECLGELYVGRSLYARSAWDQARPHLARAANLADRGNLFAGVTALFWLGATDGDTGDMNATERSMVLAQEISAPTSGDPDLAPASGIADVGLAFVRLNQLEPADASRLAERGTKLLERTTFAEMVFRAYFVWAEALSLEGRYAEADAVVEEGNSWLRGRSIAGPLEAWLWLSQSRNASRQGRYDEASGILDRIRRSGGLGGSADVETVGFFEAAAILSLALRRGDVERSRRLFDELPPAVPGYVPFQIEWRVLEAAVLESEGEMRAAAGSMTAAVEMAIRGFRYQFSHVGPVAVPILERIAGRTEHDAHVRSILDRLPKEAGRRPSAPVDPLTDRELEVLAEVAAGYTNAEIADRLYISKGTVKRHTANIYVKLAAHHRAEAVAKGRALGLIG